MKNRFTINLVDGSLERSKGGVPVASGLAKTITAGDVLDAEFVIKAGSTNITSTLLADGGQLRAALRANLKAGTPALAATNPATLVDDAAATTLSLNTTEIRNYLATLTDTAISGTVWFEVEVQKADGSYRETLWSEQFTLERDAVREADEPPPVAAESALTAQQSAQTAAAAAGVATAKADIATTAAGVSTTEADIATAQAAIASTAADVATGKADSATAQAAIATAAAGASAGAAKTELTLSLQNHSLLDKVTDPTSDLVFGLRDPATNAIVFGVKADLSLVSAWLDSEFDRRALTSVLSTAGVAGFVANDGTVLLGVDLAGRILNPHLQQQLASLAALNARWLNVAESLPFGVFSAGSDGTVLLGLDSSGRILNPEMELMRRALSAGLPTTAVLPRGLNHILCYGQSNAAGGTADSIWDGAAWIADTSGYKTKWQPFSNLTFNGFGSTTPLIGGDIALYYGDGDGVEETPVPSMANQLTRVSGWRFLGSSAGVGGTSIVYLGKPLVYATKALMDADLAPRDTQAAVVTSDPTSAYNGAWVKSGASGAGTWTRTLPVIGGSTLPWDYFLSHLANGASRAAFLSLSYFVPAVVWIQGESDRDVVNPAKPAYISQWYYRDKLLALYADVVAAVKAASGQAESPLMLIDQIQHDWERVDNLDTFHLGLNQWEAAKSNPGIAIATPRYPITTAIHYTTHGQRWLGAYLAKAFRRAVIDGKPWKPLQPESWSLAGSEIRVRFNVPSGRLQFSTNSAQGGNIDTVLAHYGFEYSDGSGRTISSIAISGADEVVITLSGAAGANASLSYVRSDRFGNLCDTESAPAYYGGADGAPFDLRNWCLSFQINLN